MSYAECFYAEVFNRLMKKEGIIPFSNDINREVFAEIDRLHTENEELKEMLSGLVEDIKTPARLGLSSINPEWANFHRANNFLENKGE